MNIKLEKKVQHLLQGTRRHKRWNQAVRIMAGVVVLSVIASLTLAAITMERKPLCGFEEHVHTEECYQEQWVLVCGHDEVPVDDHILEGLSAPEKSEDPLTDPVIPPEDPSPSDEPKPEKTPVPAIPDQEPVSSPDLTAKQEDSLSDAINEPELAIMEPEPMESALAEPETAPTEPGSVPAEPETAPTETESVPTEPEPAPSETESAPAEPEPAPIEPEPAQHVHTPECFELRRVLICDQVEHTHSDDCYEQSDPTADVESPSDWEASVNSALLTGDWAQDTISIAQTQIGYQESKLNFIWDEQGNKMGYSRYGDWYGIEYGHWCAMFVAFCLHYGGVPDAALPVDPNCNNWIALLDSAALFRLPESYPPVAGDLIFFDLNEDGESDHIGLVESVEAAEDGSLTAIHTIEGNTANGVHRRSYEPGDTRIAGYCPLAEAKTLYDGMEPAGQLNFTYEDEMLSASVTITGQQVPLAPDTRLVVTGCTPERTPDLYENVMGIGEAALEASQTLSGFSLFDIKLVSGDIPQEISPEAEVTVDVQFHQPLFPPDLVQAAAALRTFVLDAPLNVEPPVADSPAPQAMTMAEPLISTEEPAAQEIIPSEKLESAVSQELPASEEVESTYGGTAEGVTKVNYTTRGLRPFAVMLANHTQSGKFWKEVRHGEKMEKGQTYMIVSAEGGYALTNNGGNVFTKAGSNYTPVQLQPVKGNPGYYTVPNAPETIKWKYNEVSGANSSPRLTQMYKGKKCFINPAFPVYLFVPEGNAGPLQFNNSKAPSCFHIENRKQSKYISIDTMTSGFTGVTTPAYDNDIRDSDMLILKMVDTTLTIPDDAVDESGGNGQIGSAAKPQYPAYIAPSGEKTGSYEDPSGKVDYFSDPSTTQLEKYFGCHPLNGGTDFNAQKVDNGKAMMDKSVIYGHDDYGAFAKYDNGTFSTTLSALGQAFVVDQSTTKVPIDVLLILDMSNSMNETDKGQSKCRAKILVESINKTMTNIMKAHPENRVCAVSYNSGAYDLLHLGHHLPDVYGKFFQYTVGGKNEFGYPRISIQATGLSSHVGGKIPCEAGTYTQMGIAKGYDLLMRNTPTPADTTYTTTVNGQTVTKPRKPVIILVSDGEPTHCTNHYTDVLNNPYYGDGLGPVSNGKGAQGYYTILSANYYKRMVGIHYDNPATMYTIAFGMKEGEYKLIGDSAATNHYRATVMNPTQSNIDNLLKANTKYSINVEKALYNMLTGHYSGNYQEVGKQLDLIPSMGKPHVYIPILKDNLYKGNYAYADKAYLGNTGNSGLDAAFDEIIKLNTVYDFSYETQSDKPLTLSDPIGDGMEVKGDPVLRVNGKNYAHTGKQTQDTTTVYTYSGVVPMDPYTGRTVDLSTIKVRVDNVSGKQTVTMEIPPKSLPTYTADPTMSFYHEALPIRLIYQVGLSAAGQAEIDTLQPGHTKVFYTNRYTGGVHAKGTLEPSDKNPYYKRSGWQVTNNKTSNPTGTDGTSLVKDGNASLVNYSLGNNGKLVITKKEAISTDQISVEKKWQNYDGTEMTEGMPAEITATLYRTYDENGKTVREKVMEFTLNAENGWKRTFTPEELNPVPGRVYQYYVDEAAVEGYKVSYSGDGVSSNDPETPIVITNRYQYSDVLLPVTGGPGTAPYLISGSLLIALCFVYQCVIRLKRGERRNS